jgi:hypothetical protein
MNFFKRKLPDCDKLFEKYLSPWYPENDRPTTTRPDLYQIAAYEGKPLNFEDLQYLHPEHLHDVKRHITETMTDAALQDFQHIIKSDKLDFRVLDAVDKYYDKARVAELIKESDPADFSNPYLVTICEFGVMLGHLFNELEDFEWLYSNPYFHSIIVHKNTGFGITVFDWSVKKFSGYGVDDGFVAKFHAAIQGIKEHL